MISPPYLLTPSPPHPLTPSHRLTPSPAHNLTPTSGYLYFDPLRKGKSQTSQDDDFDRGMPSFGESDAVVFVTGGVTYAEAQNLKDFVKSSNRAAKERASAG